MKNEKEIRALVQLYRIIDAGERGFATAAANIPNQGTKLILKTYAQQRARFKTEILTELQHLGSDRKPGSSIPGMIHRGRVAIFGALTIEEERRERVILKEAALGERVAIRTYQKTLKANLPTPTRKVVERQLEEVRKVSEQIILLHGLGGNRLVVLLFNSEKSAAAAMQTLHSAGLHAKTIEKISINDLELYQGRGATIPETVLSGAVGGAIWGGLTGIPVGFGVLQTISPVPVGTAANLGVWSLVTLGFILLGIFIASFMALFIGAGISDQDTHLVREIKEHSQILVKILADKDGMAKANQALNQLIRVSSNAVEAME